MRQVMERFEGGGEARGEAEVSAAAAAVKRVRRVDFIVDGNLEGFGAIKEVE